MGNILTRDGLDEKAREYESAVAYKKFIEAIVCVADYLQYVPSHRSSVHINYFGTGPRFRPRHLF